MILGYDQWTGMLIKVRVFADSNQTKVVKKAEDSYDVWVKEKPIMGQANKAVIRALTDFFKMLEEDGSRIRIIKGFKEPHKIVKI